MAAYFSVVTNNSLCDCAPSSLSHPLRSPQLAARGQTPFTTLSLDPEEISSVPKNQGDVEEGMKLLELNGLLGVTDLTPSSAWGTIPFFAGKETRVGVWK